MAWKCMNCPERYHENICIWNKNPHLCYWCCSQTLLGRQRCCGRTTWKKEYDKNGGVAYVSCDFDDPEAGTLRFGGK